MGPEVRIAVRGWAACAPGLSGAEDWRRWSLQPTVPAGDLSAGLPQMAPMMRRRLNALGRMALQAAWECQGDDLGLPLVFASRYGDATRSLGLLEELCQGQDVSPTGFNMSVHNAIGALYAIARQDRSNSVSVAAGRASAAAGLLEAASLLADGADEALLVCYDDTLPSPYEPFADEPPCAWAWAWRVAAPADGEGALSLALAPLSDGDEPDAPAGALPAGLEVLRFFLSGERELQQRVEGRCWQWRREERPC